MSSSEYVFARGWHMPVPRFFMILEGWQDPAPFRPAISCAHRRYKYTFSAILKIYFCKSLKIFPDIIENQSRICYHQTEGWVRHGVGRPGIEHENKGAELRSVSGFLQLITEEDAWVFSGKTSETIEE